MASTSELAEKVSAHLTYLGYGVESDREPGVLLARHSSLLNVVAFSSDHSLILHAGIAGFNRRREQAIVATANTVNANLVVSRVYCERDDAGGVRVVVRAWHPAAYARAEFATFMELFHNDQAEVMRSIAQFAD